MKPLNILLLFSLCLLTYSCSSDDDLNFNAASLKQTSWGGTRTQSYNGGETILHSDVGIVFHTEERGEYDLKEESDPEPRITRFTYSIDGKMLHIENNVLLGGYWLLIESGKNKMVLEQSSGGEYSYRETMTLTRNH